jgi:Eco57I restriction-modification methylase
VLTLRACATLLGSAASHDGLIRITRTIGFDGTATQLDDDLCTAIGVLPETVEASIVIGAGSLRALVFTQSGGPTLRETFTRLAPRLASRTPHVLWVIIAAQVASDTVAIGVPSAGKRPRVAALVVDRARIMDSDAETLRLLVAAQSADDLAKHGRFAEILGRDAMSRRFFRTLEQCVTGLATSADRGPADARSAIALLYASRLLFLGFLEAKGWLDNDPAFLTRLFDECMATGGGFHSRVLLPLFFGTLNTPISQRARRARHFGKVPFLNGGLFTPTPSERLLKPLRFGDEALGRFFGELFSRYRFTAREESTSFEEAAIDPEMLGRTFECLMAARSRRTSGAFYTPHELVERVTSCGLEQSLAARLGAGVAERLVRGGGSKSPHALAALTDLRLLDPACGSGAFLVHALDRVASLRRECGDDRDLEVIRRDVLARSIFGVDCNPTAVWLCQLRLWLSIVIETHQTDAAAVPPLPNLDRNIRVGDSLAGDAFGDAAASREGQVFSRLRERYSRATGRRKASLSRMLDREERRLLIQRITADLAATAASRRDLLTARRGRDLFGGRYVASSDELKFATMLRIRSVELRRRLRSVQRGDALPFSFPAHFVDVAAKGGFSLVVGNPPWVRPHRLDVRAREEFRRRFIVARSAPWAAGARAAGAGHGFSAQVDLAALFVERSLGLLAPNAALSLLLPSKLWRSLAGGGLRRLVMDGSRIGRVEDYSDVPTSFDAAVYPGLLVASRRSPSRNVAEDECAHISVLHRARLATTWKSHPPDLAWDHTAGAPWILIPPEVRRAFELLREAGVPLSASTFGRPLLGVKCGLNEAFVVTPESTEGNLVRVASANGRRAHLESAALRPVARGEDVRCWIAPRAGQSIVWPYDANGTVLTTLPAGVAHWLTPYRRALLARADARSAAKWWSLFRIESARCDVPRVIWADIGRTPRATVLDAGDPTVPLNSCYVARCPTSDDALALSALINSSLLASWLSVVAEPARGGYRRYLGWTMALLPVPTAWEEHRPKLASLAIRARLDSESVTRSEVLSAAIDAYGLTRRVVEPLLTWSAP